MNLPVPVRIRSGIREFVWIGAEVEHLWDAKASEGLSPYLQGSLATLFHEYQLPIVEAYAKHITIVTEIEIDIPRTFCYFASQVWQQVETVDMILIGSSDGFVSILQFLHYFCIACHGEESWRASHGAELCRWKLNRP